MERPGLVKSISAFFVFLAAFLFVAGYLGGGLGGLAWAAIVAVVVAVVYLVFYGWIVRLPIVRRVPHLASPADRVTRSRPEPKPDLMTLLTRGERNVCDPGPYDVEAGRPTKISLEVERGFTLVGTLEEADGDDFEYMIVDEDNWVGYQQGFKHTVEDSDAGEGVYKIKWEVPAGGPWFLILEAYGKQLVRQVYVHLRLSAAP